jgi:hypothetical protein
VSAFVFLPPRPLRPAIGTELAATINPRPQKEFPVRILICTVMTAITLLAAPAAMAERDDGPQPGDLAPGWLMAIDFVFVRPPSFFISIASTAVFVASLPITYPIGAATGPRSLGTYIVTAPWRFMSSRYYGNFTEYRDHRTITGREIRD